MQISNMTSVFWASREGRRIPTIEAVRRLHALGYRHIDLDLCSMARGESEFCEDGWREAAAAVREEMEKLGMTFVQSHVPFYSGRIIDPAKPEYNAYFYDMLMRSAEVLQIAGVPLTIVHPMCARGESKENMEANLAENKRFYVPFLERLAKANVVPAFENMINPKGFGSFTFELAALLDLFRDYNPCICWDVGHANITFPDQTWAIGQLKGRIRAVHLHDNQGAQDDHLMPFLGTVRWEKVMPALREAGFDGDLVLELGHCKNLPDGLLDANVAFSMKVTEKLLEMYNA